MSLRSNTMSERDPRPMSLLVRVVLVAAVLGIVLSLVLTALPLFGV
ncbi:hypothetical protein [Pelagibacterium sp. H642]|nr:hypothetical protein [Pelagibacterium sp. H642]WMT90095.1 hypothetical protein NO934_15050 [Pelagibacterium sp. H642]